MSGINWREENERELLAYLKVPTEEQPLDALRDLLEHSDEWDQFTPMVNRAAHQTERRKGRRTTCRPGQPEEAMKSLERRLHR
jgi:hypothetical protein